MILVLVTNTNTRLSNKWFMLSHFFFKNKRKRLIFKRNKIHVSAKYLCLSPNELVKQMKSRNCKATLSPRSLYKGIQRALSLPSKGLFCCYQFILTMRRVNRSPVELKIVKKQVPRLRSFVSKVQGEELILPEFRIFPSIPINEKTPLSKPDIIN